MNNTRMRKTTTIPMLTNHIVTRSLSGTRGGVRLAQLLNDALLKITKIAEGTMRAMIVARDRSKSVECSRQPISTLIQC